MRKFIISDIHGNGNLYHSVMSYLENINKEDEVILYINGDLIDRGIDSAEILLDVIDRINNKRSFDIVFLGGNHELLMYQIYQDRLKGIESYFNNWYDNGGYITDDVLNDILDDKDRILEVVDFIANLDIYHKFEEQIDHKNIILSHAACPLEVKDNCDLKIKTNNDNLYYLVWARKDDPFIPFRCRIGHNDYFSIVGHTPNDREWGYFYDKDENYLNIAGGSAAYVSGFFEYNNFPLVEVKDGYLKILTFNSNNEIIYGSYFFKYNMIVPFSSKELKQEREYLSKSFKPKKLIRTPDGIIEYEK